MSETYRIETFERGQWIPAPGDATGWTLAEARRAVANGLLGFGGEQIDESDVRIVPEDAHPADCPGDCGAGGEHGADPRRKA